MLHNTERKYIDTNFLWDLLLKPCSFIFNMIYNLFIMTNHIKNHRHVISDRNVKHTGSPVINTVSYTEI